MRVRRGNGMVGGVMTPPYGCGGSLAPSLRGLAAKQTGGVWFLRRTLPPTSLRSATSL